MLMAMLVHDWNQPMETNFLAPTGVDSNKVHSTYFAALKSIFWVYVVCTLVFIFLETFDFYSTTSERQILNFWPHYISMKVPVTHYLEA